MPVGLQYCAGGLELAEWEVAQGEMIPSKIRHLQVECLNFTRKSIPARHEI